MSHFFTVVLIPETTEPEHMKETVSRLLAPYDENVHVDPYKMYLSREEIERMARHYQQSSQNLTELARSMEEWTGEEGGGDEEGLYRLRTSNPQAKWDWWVIGGRWNGEVRANPQSDETGFNFGDQYHQLEENMLPVRYLDHTLPCFALVTPDGAWHEQGKMGWWATITDEKTESAWKEEVVKIIQQHQDTILVGVDCHI
jgi:hypothetical protein